MRTIGLIGGMSWHSTMTYYRLLNEQVAARRGGHASARVVLQSLDFAEVRDCQVRGDWQGSGELLADAARRCVAGGAELLAICTNLMHKNFPQVEQAVPGVEVVHIADAVAACGYRRLGLLGTRWVMEETFYADRLARHGVDVVVPDEAGRELVDRVVFDELTQGVFREESRTAYLKVMDDLAAQGADGIVLACTEIGLLVPAELAPLPVVDSAVAHATALADRALLAPAPLAAG
ncbi:aspartate/glutamate racemase family protein [Nocardioides mangrovicus]|uniref:Aspartate/glutamate racemase family protein n=1 Tax=Nocardioides mangrovicus TaxID=2478913 RepID=A0A3L8P8S3_9ACTN|nr:aspartate/glutamate racemase family protein [Nocardioides mangrovicus]RLV51169.1 aspartate/glutamate racemase family protein [Nocardioides mangrovicus]